MLEIKAKLKVARSAYRLEVRDRLSLPFALRRGAHARVKLESGEEAALRLPRGEVLRGGDLVTASDGRVIEVLAEAEQLMQVECAGAARLARIAWHLGSEHVPVEVGAAFLRVAADPALEARLRRMGATLSALRAPFEPEVAAGEPHAHGHEHGAHDHRHPHKH